ncbi:MAG: efflux RND transporter periplasmic adaptor subunit [Deltaproteobacteria bacterium]|nr:efflux RND transporter periplasmic adaptor subunit [Deltaproteobacteria bacterium]
MKSRTIIGPGLAAGCLILAVAAAGCSGKVGEATADKGKKVEASSRVKVASPAVRTLHRRLEYTGTVEPIRQVRIVPEVTAKILSLKVQNGDRVKKGQLLARFDTKLFGLQRKQASAAVKLAQTQVKSTQKEWDRLQPLAESGAVSKSQLDQLESGLDAANAQVDQAKAALSLASYSVQKSTLKAPFDGIVTNLLVNEGEFVGPQMAAYGMLTLVDISEVKVKVGVTEKDLPLVTEGLGVEIMSEAYPDTVFTGKVGVLNPSADPISKSFPVEIRAANPDELLKAGMFVRVQIHIETREDVLTVPADAIVKLKDKNVIYVLDKDGRAVMREIETGIESDGGVEITKGELTTDEKVVTEGNFGLKDGSRVIVIE